MPRQQLQPPYTKVLSALLKTDLVRLCVELRLPSDGSVVGLRTRLKDYLTRHRAALAINPRFTALFPRHNRINQPPAPLPLPNNPPPPPPSTSALSYADDEFEPWNGIEGHEAPGDEQDLVPIPPLDQYHHGPVFPQDDYDHDPPPPPSSPPGSSSGPSDRGFSPPEIHHDDERKSS
jgi:hypothetical protein